ncbi:MAG: PKD domain-containing protein [Clostridiales bacterium]|jgi:hypothetical protein|nr:PKD domain-containing protein [Clostridiales bacterium]
MKGKYYNCEDWDFSKAYCDADEWRDKPLRHRYMHGGIEGSELKFSFYFPPKELYKRRFYHFVAPAQGSENASQTAHGEDDKIAFALSHGAYFVESNMGGADASGEDLLRNNAAAARYSRMAAEKVYGAHRPYGYIYGGSGGSLKTCACFENTDGIWDGAVPFVIASPMAIPSAFTVRAHAYRLIRNKLAQIIDAVEPGGSGDIYAGLNAEEREALEEATRMGFPVRTWFAHYFMGDGALPVLTPMLYAADPAYYKDFWNVEGYLGADPQSSASRERIMFTTKLKAIHIPERILPEEFKRTGVDDAWHIFDNIDRFAAPPTLELEDAPKGEALYLRGTDIYFIDGAAAGHRLPLSALEGKRVTIGETFGVGTSGQPSLYSLLSSLKPGDGLRLDNSDYLALQTFHRHQVPKEDYPGWRQFTDAEGRPRYPQRPIIGPQIAFHGSGGIQNGHFTGKMIVLACLMDESAFPCMADWYRGKVRENLGEKTDGSFRLWYMDNAMHAETAGAEARLHVVDYIGALQQALLDIAEWVENGVAPPESTNYAVKDAQVIVPAEAAGRAGIQPVVSLRADGGGRACVPAGRPVVLSGRISAPNGVGRIIYGEWDLEGRGDFGTAAELRFVNSDKTVAETEITHVFGKPGTYFPVLRAASNRDENDGFTLVKNLARVRVVVS